MIISFINQMIFKYSLNLQIKYYKFCNLNILYLKLENYVKMNECFLQILQTKSLIELIFLQEFKQSLEVLLVQIEVIIHGANVVEYFEITVVKYSLNQWI